MSLSGLSAAGTSSRVEGPNTAEPAETTTCPAPEAGPERTDGSAPTASTPCSDSVEDCEVAALDSAEEATDDGFAPPSSETCFELGDYRSRPS
jgi:hypothetical protein